MRWISFPTLRLPDASRATSWGGIIGPPKHTDQTPFTSGRMTGLVTRFTSQMLNGTGIFTYIYYKNQLNVGKYTLHWASGYGTLWTLPLQNDWNPAFNSPVEGQVVEIPLFTTGFQHHPRWLGMGFQPSTFKTITCHLPNSFWQNLLGCPRKLVKGLGSVGYNPNIIHL